MSDLQRFIEYLGWRDGENVFILRIYGENVSLHHQILFSSDLVKAQKLIDRYNGTAQIYVTVNPHSKDIGNRSAGKRETILCVKNVYIDVDSEHPGKNPANMAEIGQLKDTVDSLEIWLNNYGAEYNLSFTGNGFRFIIPIPDSHPNIDKKVAVLLKSMKNKYPSVDTAVSDASRITGVPGTMNVKEETEDRKNRMRDGFPGKERVENARFCDEIWDIPDPKAHPAYKENVETNGKIDELVKGLVEESQVFRTLLKTAIKAKKGERSKNDFRMCSYLAQCGINRKDMRDILRKYGSEKTNREAYVNLTVDAIFKG